MTAEKAKKIQDDLAKHYNLGHWYGIHCEKCCGVYPKLMTKDGFDPKSEYYQCVVCGKRTKAFTMPWLAEQAWNNHEYMDEWSQMSLF